MTPRVTDALTLGPLTVQDRPAEARVPVSPRARPRGHSLHSCTAAPWRDPSALPKSEAAQHPSVGQTLRVSWGPAVHLPPQGSF